MLLFASSNRAAYAVASALKGADIESGVGRERGGFFPVSVNVEPDREARALAIAKRIDPGIQVQSSRP